MRAYEVSQSLQRLDLQSSILNNIGNVYMVNDEDSVSAVYFEKSIEIEKNLGDSRRSQLAVRLGNVSTAYMKLGRCEDAISAAEEGLRIDKEVGRPNKIAVRMNQLGDVYVACGRQQDAIQCEREAKLFIPNEVPSDISDIYDYCKDNGYSTEYCFLTDFSKPSGIKRFCIYSFKENKNHT